MTIACSIRSPFLRTSHITVSHEGRPLRARVLLPTSLSGARPLIALHGISRDAEALARHFRPEAERSGRIIVVPHFTAADWPKFQRPAPRARADRALLALLDALAGSYPGFLGPVDLFGFSGGAQLAHRSAMLYPQRFGDLHLGSAGWYCLPDTELPYPYGLAPGTGQSDALRQCKLVMLPRFLDRRIRVYVGEGDIHRDPALRQNALVDASQGRTRLDRARNYVSALNAAARSHDLPARADLTSLPDCGHDFDGCASRAELARIVASPAPTIANALIA